MAASDHPHREASSPEVRGTLSRHASLRPLILSIVVFVAGAVSMAIVTPPGGAPDEPPHMAYIRSIAERHQLPALPGSTLADQPGRIVSQQAQHPPLYYVVSAPVWWLTGGNETAAYWALRSIGVIVFATVIVVTWLCVMAVFGAGRMGHFISSAAVFVLSVSTTYACVGGGVNNEAPAILLGYTALLLAISRGHETNWWRVPLFTGLIMGCALLTKLTVVALVPATLWAVLRRKDTSHMWTWSAFRGPVVALMAIAALISPWLAYNMEVYGRLVASPVHRGAFAGGWPHALAVPDQLLTVGTALVREFVMGTFAPYWLFRPTLPYAWILVPTALFWCAVALVIVVSKPTDSVRSEKQRMVLLGLITIPIVLYLGMLHQTVTMAWDAIIFAARYVPVASPALAVGAGIAAWRLGLARRPRVVSVCVALMLSAYVLMVYWVMRFFLTH